MQREFDWIVISTFFLELAVGACMFLIVSWLLLFRLKEIKECWHLYTSIRFYFGLTLIGTAVNLALGLCGTFYVLQNFEGCVSGSGSYRVCRRTCLSWCLWLPLRGCEVFQSGGCDVTGGKRTKARPTHPPRVLTAQLARP